ncbi:uncharacterized protein [Diadema setosum]|uniref:uncharacterized protein n=1 Tax=Diadema setosum TaxID=31175 RepID=UPI003B3B14C4
MMNRRKEYKSIMQKVVGRQNSTLGGGGGGRATSPERRQRQRQMLQEIRQNISEARFETNEAIEQMSSEMRRMNHRLSRSSTTDAEDESVPLPPLDYGTTDTLRAMKQLILTQKQPDKDKVTTKAECSSRPPEDEITPCDDVDEER